MTKTFLTTATIALTLVGTVAFAKQPSSVAYYDSYGRPAQYEVISTDRTYFCALAHQVWTYVKKSSDRTMNSSDETMVYVGATLLKSVTYTVRSPENDRATLKLTCTEIEGTEPAVGTLTTYCSPGFGPSQEEQGCN